MATITSPQRKRVNVEFTTTGAGAQTYSIKMADSATKGTLFGLMGYTDKNDKVTAGATQINRETALENGLVVAMMADLSRGNRTSSKKIYIPVAKLEETIKGAPGKTLGTWQVKKVRSVRVRVIQ